MEWHVSAVLTTYNRPELAARALESILKQTHPPEEIIVVEDAGSANVSDVVRSVAGPGVRYIRHEKNRGLAAARNTGINAAKYKFVAFLDDDDEWLPARLESQFTRFSELDVDAKKQLACLQVGCAFVGQDGREIARVLPVNQGNLQSSIRKFGAITPSSCFLFSRRALEAVGGFDETLSSGIDHDIWMSLAVAGYSNEAIRDVGTRIYVDDRETMMTDTRKRILGVSQFLDKWLPAYVSWFGPVDGQLYAKSYFLKVIGRLCAQKFARGEFREGQMAMTAISRYVGADLKFKRFVSVQIVKQIIVRYAPSVLRVNKKIRRVCRVQS